MAYHSFLVTQIVKSLPAIQETQGSIPGSGRSPEEGNGNPLQYSCLGKSHGWRSLECHSPRRSKEPGMTEQLHFNGIPTQQKAVIKCFQLFVHEANNSLQFLFMTVNKFKRRGQGVLTEETILSSEWMQHAFPLRGSS